MICDFKPATRAAVSALIIASFSLIGCSNNIVNLTILSTSDFHGALESTLKDPETGRSLGSAASLAATIREERSANPNGTIYIDGGDSLMGTALSNFSKGRAVVEIMNMIGLDATAIGNHEFDFGVDELADRIGEADYPFLAANIVNRRGGKPPTWATPYKIFELHGVRVAVIGLATVSTPLTTMPSNVEHLHFLEPAPIVNRLVHELVPDRADLVVVVGHIGVFTRDGKTAVLGELADLAPRLKGVAALVGGHTHQLFAGRLSGIPAIEAAHSGSYLGRIDIAFNTKRHRVRSSKVHLLKIFADPADGQPELRALVAKYSDRVADLMQQVIAVASTPIGNSRGSESAMANLVTDGWRSQIDAEIVIQNPGGIRNSFNEGPITNEDLYRVLPFENTVVGVQMTGAEVKELLIQGVTHGRPLEVSGLRYTIDISVLPAKILHTEPNLQSDRIYEVSINSFMAAGGDGLEILKNRPEAVDTGLTLRDVVAEWLRRETAAGREIEPVLDRRVKVITN